MEWISSSFLIGYGEADNLRQHMHKKEFFSWLDSSIGRAAV